MSRHSSPIDERPFQPKAKLEHESSLLAQYGKVAKFLAVQPYDGGYISFSCRWVPYGAAEQPLRTLY